MTAKAPWFRKYWAAHRGRFRYVPIAWQGWAILLAALAAPHLVWLVPERFWPPPVLRLPASLLLLLIALALLFRLVKARSVEIEAG
ncbi:MAG: hypothetical protein ACK564_14525 [Novosphingobium sp.]